MRRSADQETPWAAFSDQSVLWSSGKLKALSHSWPPLAAGKLSLGDVTIRDVAEYYAQMGSRVEILTGDVGLKANEPIAPPARASTEAASLSRYHEDWTGFESEPLDEFNRVNCGMRHFTIGNEVASSYFRPLSKRSSAVSCSYHEVYQVCST